MPSGTGPGFADTHGVLINCSNLHVGGGVAVATSILNEISRLPKQAERIVVLASSEVTRNLRSINTQISAFQAFRTLDVKGPLAATHKKQVRFADFDVVFTVFGPLYGSTSGSRNIMGFAQPWVAYPRNPAFAKLTRPQRLKTRLKYGIQSRLFDHADILVVEHEHVRAALKSQGRFRDKAIEVVPNVVDRLILQPSMWKPIHLPPRSSALRLGLVSRNYPHKNLAVLPRVGEELRSKHNTEVEFFVTFSEAEYRACSASFRKVVQNVGPLQLAQSPAFNSQLDGVIFPTLLECFSATPLEALATRTPLFASDRPFVRETVKDHGVFFDPLDPTDIARSIAAYFDRPIDDRLSALEAGYEYVTRGSYTSQDRALAILEIIGKEAARIAQL